MEQAFLRCGVPFSDHMVLQAGREVKLWGECSGAAPIVVRFREHEVQAEVADGSWRAALPPMNYGGPDELVIEQAGVAALRFADILVGEVWVAGGQSNMQWALEAHRDGARFIAESGDDDLRILQMPVLEYGTYAPGAGQWRRCAPEMIGSFSAVAYFFAVELRRRLQCPVGIIGSYCGATNNEFWTPRDLLVASPACRDLTDAYDASVASFATEADYERAHDAFLVEFKAWEDRGGWDSGCWPYAPLGPKAFQRPSGFYETMIRPLQPYSIRGVIWYQGEGNTERPQQYREMFPLLVNGWRRDWGQGDFPFYYVQLPMWGKHGAGPCDWAVFREIQQEFENTLSNVGMASAAECGDFEDIHPTWKVPIGRRLAALACNRTYGQGGVDAGPVPGGMRIEGCRVVVIMRQVHGGLEWRGSAEGVFEIAGGDGIWHAATAVIDGNTLCCESADEREPMMVRYAFANYAEQPLYNGAGFPAPPFRLLAPGRA